METETADERDTRISRNALVIAIVVIVLCIMGIVNDISKRYDRDGGNVTEKSVISSFGGPLGETFKIGCGTNENGIVYYVYTKGKKGNKLVECEAAKTYINETLADGQEPYMETVYTVEYRGMSLVERWDEDEDSVKIKGKKYTEHRTLKNIKLYVPKNYEVVVGGGNS